MKSILALALSAMLLLGGVAWVQFSPAQATDATDATSATDAADTTDVTDATSATDTADTTVTEEITYPLTGLPAVSDTWRPVAVSVSSTALHLTGVSSASVMYEVLAQGTDTRLALLFNHVWEMPTTGAVDEATDILWQLVMPQNAILVQNGWNVYAENLLNCYAYQPVDAQIEGTTAFVYDNGGDVSLDDEDCWFIAGAEVYTALESYGIAGEGETRDLFSFGENTTALESATGIYVQYSSTSGTFLSYNSESGQFLMNSTSNGLRVDAATGETVAFDNVFVLKADSSIKDDGYTREYDLSSGTGVYLTDGTWQKITWYKGDVTDALIVLDADGNELTVNTGTSYIGIYGGFTGQMVNLTTAQGDYNESIFD